MTRKIKEIIKSNKISVNIMLFEKYQYDKTVIYMENIENNENGLKSIYVKKCYKPSSNIIL